MTIQEIQNIINKGEGLTIEFKQAKNKLPLIRNNRPNHPWLALNREAFFNAAGLYRINIKTGEQGFTQAALLLFGKEEIIQSAIPYYKIDALLRRVDVDRYDDRENIRCNLIEAYDILEPGKFEPFSKNPAIAKFFVQMAFAEDLGTGINKVYQFLKLYANTIPIFIEEDNFLVEIPLYSNVPKDRKEVIISLIKENKAITMSQMAEKCNVNIKSIKRDIEELKIKGALKRVDGRKTGYWKIKQ